MKLFIRISFGLLLAGYVLTVAAPVGVLAASPERPVAAKKPPVKKPPVKKPPVKKPPVKKPPVKERPYGIEQRTAWTTSRISGSAEAPLPYAIERVFKKLTFKNPVEFVAVPGTNRILIVEVLGRIVTFVNDADTDHVELAVDLRKEISGLKSIYGFAFHPRFRENGYCYIAYIMNAGLPEGTRVSRFKVTGDNPPRIDPKSELNLINWLSGGHNGTSLQFGPDGYLYISTGDGGPAFPPDPLKSGQDVGTLMSSILRIDVDHPNDKLNYSIPTDNPFVDLAGARGEIWAYGFRNPWRMSFDSKNGSLWTGDVGWELWEMVYRVEKGGNYGWSIMEGPQGVHQERKRGPTPISPPIIAHSHNESRSITGGYVYHGSRLKDLEAAYIYGDYVTGKIWGVKHDGKQVTWKQELVDTTLPIVCFGVDAANELYVVAHGDKGTIHRLIPNPRAGQNTNFPTRLSETGLFASVKDHRVASGVVAYDVNAQPWADHAVAERFVALPHSSTDGKGKDKVKAPQIANGKGEWTFPNNGVLAKTISLEMERGNPKSMRRIETQIMHYNVDTWQALTYMWNDEQTDAVLVGAEGDQRTFEIADQSAPGGHRRQTWRFAARTECLLCHNAYSGGSICGFNVAQLNRNRDYGTVVDNQLRTLSHIGLLTKAIKTTDAKTPPPKLTSPYESTGDLTLRARAYLHVNCAHCHRPGGGGTSHMNVKSDIAQDKTRMLNLRPSQGTFAIHGAQVVAPGDPYRSILYYRMAKLGRGRMPHFGSRVVDKQGLALMHDWIASLPVDEKTKKADTAHSDLRNRQRAMLQKLAAANGGGASQSEKETVNQLLTSTSGALMLLRAVDAGEVSQTVVRQIIQAATAHSDVQIRDLFERFVPEEQRVKRLGSVIKPAELLAIKGDAARGRQVFFQTAGVACKNCHQIGKEGKQVGPDLTTIGKKYDRAKLLENILDPSRVIDPKFASYLVETKRGRVLTGLLVKKTDKLVVLRDSDGKDVSIKRSSIETMASQRKSLMPDLQLRDMTAHQVADLLAFLESLK